MAVLVALFCLLTALALWSRMDRCKEKYKEADARVAELLKERRERKDDFERLTQCNKQLEQKVLDARDLPDRLKESEKRECQAKNRIFVLEAAIRQHRELRIQPLAVLQNDFTLYSVLGDRTEKYTEHWPDLVDFVHRAVDYWVEHAPKKPEDKWSVALLQGRVKALDDELVRTRKKLHENAGLPVSEPGTAPPQYDNQDERLHKFRGSNLGRI